jgi:predicted O-methyltransferase YrrM
MSRRSIHIPNELYDYILEVSLREPSILKELREETSKLNNALMQISPDQGQFMSMLVKIIGAKRTLDIGTYTGYSSLCVALSMPEDSITITCEVSEVSAEIARRYWEKAGISDKIDLRMGFADKTLDSLITEGAENSFDFIFIDADKLGYDSYYEKSLKLLRQGGLIAIDNVFLAGFVLGPEYDKGENPPKISDSNVRSVMGLNAKIKKDDRVEISMLPIGDGMTLVRKL